MLTARILFTVATRWEAAPLRRALRAPGLTLLETGMGARRTLEALAGRSADLVVSTGCAGGLQADLRTGDLVAQELTPCPEAAALVRRIEPRVRFGAIADSGRVLADPREKAELGRRTGALAVDMESAAVAAWCRERGVGALALRVILDDVSTPLPGDLPKEPGALALAGYLLRRPAALPGLADLGLRHRRAMQPLAAFLTAFLEAL